MNTFPRYTGYGLYNYCYQILEEANITLDGKFSVCASFYNVFCGGKDPKKQQLVAVIFCLEDKEKRYRELAVTDSKEYFELPKEALINFFNDKEAVVSIRLFEKVYSRDNCSSLGFQNVRFNLHETRSKVVSFRFSDISIQVKRALEKIHTNFEETFNYMTEMRALHQKQVMREETTPKNIKLENDMNQNPLEPKNLIDLDKSKSSPTKSKILMPNKPRPKSSDTTHNNNNDNNRECLYCGRKTTPMWRRGPDGPGTLCNACGVKWRHGKILCDKNDTKAASSTVTTNKKVDSINTRLPSLRAKRKSTEDTSTSIPPTKYQKEKKSTPVVAMNSLDHVNKSKNNDNDDSLLVSNSVSSSSSASPHSANLKYYHHSSMNTTIIEDDVAYHDHHSFGVDAVEAATVLTLLKRS